MGKKILFNGHIVDADNLVTIGNDCDDSYGRVLYAIVNTSKSPEQVNLVTFNDDDEFFVCITKVLAFYFFELMRTGKEFEIADDRIITGVVRRVRHAYASYSEDGDDVVDSDFDLDCREDIESYNKLHSFLDNLSSVLCDAICKIMNGDYDAFEVFDVNIPDEQDYEDDEDDEDDEDIEDSDDNRFEDTDSASEVSDSNFGNDYGIKIGSSLFGGIFNRK